MQGFRGYKNGVLAELVDVLERLSSDFPDLSDSDNDDVCYPDTSDNSDFCDILDNEPPATVHARKRNRNDDSLFQRFDTDFSPEVDKFNSDNSGISSVIDNYSTVLDFFKLFPPPT
jgi:hypothetical protein